MKYFSLIIVAGLIARALFAGHVPPSDPTFYMTLAQHVRDGAGLWVDNEVYGPNLRALFPPLYPLFLSLFPVNAYSVAALNAAFDIGTAYLIYRLADRNLMAPALFFLWPAVILNSVVAQKESLAMLLVAGLLYVRSARIFGLLGGMLALTQPALVFFPLILSAMRGWRYAGTVALFMALTLTPWIVRNALVLGAFVPLTTGAGFSLAYVVNGGHASPDTSLPEVARSTEAGQNALAAILVDPIAYVSRVVLNFARAILLDGFAFERLGYPIAMLNLALPAFFGRLDRRILIAAGLTIVSMVWLEFGERHRYFLYPLLAVVAAEAIRRARCRTRTGSLQP